MGIQNLINEIHEDDDFLLTIKEVISITRARIATSKDSIVRLILDNGYIISVSNDGKYSRNPSYELAVLNEDGLVCELSDGDCLKNQTLDQLKDLALNISKLKGDIDV